MQNWKEKLHEIIFEADTPAGKAFDIGLLIVIVLSIVVVLLESVNDFREKYSYLLNILEVIFTLLFTIEYILRIIILKKPLKYVFSFFGLIDLLSILPTLIGFVATGPQSLIVLRTLRLLRVFRIFKLVKFVGEAKNLIQAMRASRYKISVFLGFIMALTVLMGTIMYMVEGEQNGFTSIPRSMYWAIVTLTTVGYGDIAPQTALGQTIAAFIMIMGYGVLAVPTGIVTSEFTQQNNNASSINTISCQDCGLEGHENDAVYCKHCGAKL